MSGQLVLASSVQFVNWIVVSGTYFWLLTQRLKSRNFGYVDIGMVDILRVKVVIVAAHSLMLIGPWAWILT